MRRRFRLGKIRPEFQWAELLSRIRKYAGSVHSPRKLRWWPRWVIIPFGISLAGCAILLGLLVEPPASALSPGRKAPTPTLPVVAHTGTQSKGCQDCHFSLLALQESAVDPFTVESNLIEPWSAMATPHGLLGCVTCHGGNGQTNDKGSAHQDLFLDVTKEHPEKCLTCHRNLPPVFLDDRLRTPHEVIADRVKHGDSYDVYCSDCHGAVGHGFDPVSGGTLCTMDACLNCHSARGACLDCHQGQPPQARMSGCEVCHVGPHDVATTLTCNCCHISPKVWDQISLDVHPIPLSGKHGEIGCFECHQYPNFGGLRYICTDCHTPGHKNWIDHECTECHTPDVPWDKVLSPWPGHTAYWDQYRGAHLDVQCKGCHFEGFDDPPDPSCDTCHTLPGSHKPEHTQCLQCH